MVLTNSRYINALEERIAFLESRMPNHAEDHFVADRGINSQSAAQMDREPAHTTTSNTNLGWSHQSTGGSVSEDAELDDRTSLVDGVAYLSLCASGSTDTAAEPYYVGSSSGATIARMIHSSIFRDAGSRRSSYAAAASSSSQQQTASSSRTTPPSSDHSDHVSAIDFPEPEQARMLFDIFFERIHTRWPLLDRVVYEDLFTKQYVQNGLTIIERSIFHLIYAITARFLSLTRKLCSVDSEVSCSNHQSVPHSLTIHSVTSLQPRVQWTSSWSSTALPLFNFLSYSVSTVKDLLMARELGPRSATLCLCALRWACIGKEQKLHPHKKRETSRSGVESFGPVTVWIVRPA